MSIVLVTGARGLLGSSLVPYLKSVHKQVVSVSRQAGTEICADFAVLSQATRYLSQVKPDTIINLAALADVDACEDDKRAAFMANATIVKNITTWMNRAEHSPHLVQISTDQLYDGPGPHNETPVTLTNVYAQSKYEGETAAAGVLSTILRTNFFGASQCANRFSISDWIVASLRSLKPITVFEDILFSPLSISTLVEAIATVVSRRQKGTFNLGSTGGMSKADFAYALASDLGIPTDTMSRGISSSLKLKAYRPKDMRMNSTLFEDTFSVKLPTLQREIESMEVVYASVSR
jgi:dTDP-4-dehydrorhamnose reductase